VGHVNPDRRNATALQRPSALSTVSSAQPSGQKAARATRCLSGDRLRLKSQDAASHPADWPQAVDPPSMHRHERSTSSVAAMTSASRQELVNTRILADESILCSACISRSVTWTRKLRLNKAKRRGERAWRVVWNKPPFCAGSHLSLSSHPTANRGLMCWARWHAGTNMQPPVWKLQPPLLTMYTTYRSGRP